MLVNIYGILKYDTYGQAFTIYDNISLLNMTNNFKGGKKMLLNADVIFLGSETKVSVKTQSAYNMITVMKGTDTLNCMDKSIHDSYKFGQELACEFDFNTQYKQLSMIKSKLIMPIK